MCVRIGDGVVGAAQEVVGGNVKVVCELYQGFVACLSGTGFVSTDSVLGHVQVDCKADLRKMSLFSEFFQPEIDHSTCPQEKNSYVA